jgi:hypothetical protein
MQTQVPACAFPWQSEGKAGLQLACAEPKQELVPTCSQRSALEISPIPPFPTAASPFTPWLPCGQTDHCEIIPDCRSALFFVSAASRHSSNVHAIRVNPQPPHLHQTTRSTEIAALTLSAVQSQPLILTSHLLPLIPISHTLLLFLNLVPRQYQAATFISLSPWPRIPPPPTPKSSPTTYSTVPRPRPHPRVLPPMLLRPNPNPPSAPLLEPLPRHQARQPT